MTDDEKLYLRGYQVAKKCFLILIPTNLFFLCYQIINNHYNESLYIAALILSISLFGFLKFIFRHQKYKKHGWPIN